MTTLPGFSGDDAVLSEDGVYRYALTRRWSPGGFLATYVMLNPSTADASHDDATIRRCRGFAAGLGASGIVVVNLYALRARNPERLSEVADPVGPDNDDWTTFYLARAAREETPVLAAWGGKHFDVVPDRVDRVLSLPGASRLLSLGVCANGQPRHPLFVKGDTVPAPWSPRCA